MPLYLLDTDHITLLQYNNAQVLARYRQMADTDIVVSIISQDFNPISNLRLENWA